MPDETDGKKILIAASWRTGGDHQDTLVLRGWRLSSKNWNPTTSPWMKHLTWLRMVHSGDWRLHLALYTPSGACHTRRRRRYKLSTLARCLAMTRWCLLCVNPTPTPYIRMGWGLWGLESLMLPTL